MIPIHGFFLHCADNDKRDESMQNSIVDFPNIMSEVIPFIRAEINIVLIGIGGSGKTSLIQKIKNNSFDRIYDPTHNFEKHAVICDGFLFKITDFPGQSRYIHSVSDPRHYEDADYILKVVGNQKLDYHGATSIYNEIRTKLNPRTKCKTVVSKCDISANKNLSRENALHISSKTGAGFQELIDFLITDLN